MEKNNAEKKAEAIQQAVKNLPEDHTQGQRDAAVKAAIQHAKQNNARNYKGSWTEWAAKQGK